DAATRFALSVARNRGNVDGAELAAVRAAGFGDDAILEIVVNVALNVLTNYVNTVAQTEVDFPAARQRKAA
ncbi:MAG TPA: carboxymuconolactone decarboxylase family protein, partial [Pseudomonadota bacterium]|nr:carboxymuconolactone decarboxylase family protein [Pseudomonadota bacterium]